jgi:hypothetical protein
VPVGSTKAILVLSSIVALDEAPYTHVQAAKPISFRKLIGNNNLYNAFKVVVYRR